MVSLLLAGAFLCASAGTVSAAAQEEPEEETASVDSLYYPEKEHADLDYADMVYTGVDPQALDEVLEAVYDVSDGITETEDPEESLVELYDEILQILSEQYTQYVLGDIAHYKNVYDEELAEKNMQDTLAFQDMSDAAYQALQYALAGEYGSELSMEFSEDQLSDLNEYEALTDRERELIETESDLQQTYDRLAEEEYTFEYKGELWTMERLNEETPEDYDDVVAIYLGLTKQINEQAVPVFQELVRTRKELAEAEGYDTYTDYCYDVTYGRDFTGEDIAALRETVIEELCPLYDELWAMQQTSDYSTTLAETLTGDEIVDILGEHIGNIHPELLEAYEYLRDHKLYCIDNADSMLEVGFTSDLPAYGSAFIFNKTSGTIQDLETVVHEFGHFNATYHAEQNVLTDSLLVDVAEIQSQGLEMLFLDEMKTILTDDPDQLELYILTNMLDSVLSGFEYDEFQQEVYAGEEMTADELNELAMDVDYKYTQYFYDEDGKAYEWVLINHTFDSPLYYIGYATSALSALDIWTESLQDREAATDKYMRLSALPPDVPYQEAVENCGLRNMLDAENIRELAREIRIWAGLEEGSIGQYVHPGQPSEPVQPAEPGQPAETPEDEELEELLQQAQETVFLIFWNMLRVNFGVRLIVLVIGLIAFLRRKKRGGGNGGPYYRDNREEWHETDLDPPEGWR